MRTLTRALILLPFITLACGGAGGEEPAPVEPGADQGGGGSRGRPDIGSGAGGSGGVPGGGLGGGGAPGNAGGAGGGAPGDAGAADAPGPPTPARTTAGRGASSSPSSQGPVAEGAIVFSQDFEQDAAGLTPSPTSIPPSRYLRVDDPLGARGKVMRVSWESGDNFRTSPNNKPRSAISNTTYSFPYGSKVSYAWGYMITSIDINATFAQHIRPGGPMWMLEGHNDGDFIVRCGGTTQLSKKLEPMRWYDFRVEVDYRSDGYVQVFIDGEMVYDRRDNLGFVPPKTGPAHWDGGIYNTELGISNNRTRTVYISNLSIGLR